ncbi:Antitoxin, partial [Dysosmobacter welbionis]
AGSLRRSGPALRLLRRQRPHRQRRDGDRFCDRPGQSALLRQGASGGGSAVSSLGGQPASRCACL